jgi:hypothetical protein
MRDAVAALALRYMSKMSLPLKIHLAPTFHLSMILSENRYPLFRIMLSFRFEHDLVGKPVSTFPDHALVSFEHDLVGKPVSTFPDHALDAERAAQTTATPLVCLDGFALNKGAVLSFA